ncbi:MAG: UBP-type zinc finger domain-containing protein [Candidatus Promineifilaceae bacterium]
MVKRGITDRIRSLLWSGNLASRGCEHLSQTHEVEPLAQGCVECLQSGGRWVHLRLCLSCGHVGCCDNSPGRHARGHFQDSGHAVVQSFEPGEEWLYCYQDQALFWPEDLEA